MDYYKLDPNSSADNQFIWQKMGLKFEFSATDLIFEFSKKIFVIKSKHRSYHYSIMYSIDVNSPALKIEKFELKGDELAPLSTGNSGVINDGKYYLFGGKFNDERAFSTFYCLDMKTLIWKNLYDSNQINKIEHSMISIGDYIVIFGGYEGKKIYNEIILYDVKHNKVSEIKPKKTNTKHRYGHSAIFHQGEMIIFGGRDASSILKDMWSFSFINYEWVMINYTGIIKPLFRHRCIKTKDYFLIFGGATDYQSYSSILYMVNIENYDITPVKKLENKPSARCLGNIVQVENLFYLLGGFNGSYISESYCLATKLEVCDDLASNEYPSIDIKNLKTSDLKGRPVQNHIASTSSVINLESYTEWNRLETTGKIFTPRTGHSVCEYKDNIFLFGGSDSVSLQNDLYQYCVKSLTWELLKTTGENPSPRSGAKCCECKGKIYFYGGYTQKNGDYYNDMYCYDPENKFWKKLELIGEECPKVVDHTIVSFKKYL